MQPIADDLVQGFRVLFLGHTPYSHAKLLQPGARSTFANVHHPPADTDLVWLLENYGGRVAERWRNRVLMHCSCGNHTHSDTRASLWLQGARRPEVHGPWVAVGLAPSWRFYTERGRITNAFNVFCIMEDLTPPEAVERIREQEVR